MKPPTALTSIASGLIVLGFAGCSTTSDHLGSGNIQLKVGQQYVLKRDAILLANRGLLDSIENPKFKIETYKPCENYDPYCVYPRGVLPAETVIQVQDIRFYGRNQFSVIGEVLTGEFKRQPAGVYLVAKGYAGGGWPNTGKVVMNNLCGGRTFDANEMERNLSVKTD